MTRDTARGRAHGRLQLAQLTGDILAMTLDRAHGCRSLTEVALDYLDPSQKSVVVFAYQRANSVPRRCKVLLLPGIEVDERLRERLFCLRRQCARRLIEQVATFVVHVRAQEVAERSGVRGEATAILERPGRAQARQLAEYAEVHVFMTMFATHRGERSVIPIESVFD